MLRVSAAFLAGVAVTSAVFLWSDEPPDGVAARDRSVSVEADRLIPEVDDVSRPLGGSPSGSVAADADARDVTVATATTQSSGNGPDAADSESREGAPFVEFAAVMRMTPEEVEGIFEHSFETLSAMPNRHLTFEREGRMRDPASTSLEGVLVNEAWNTAPTAFSPLSIDTECRASACRARFAFGTDEGFVEALKSTMDMKLLVALEKHGFAAVDTLIIPDDYSRTMDVYLWREAESAR